MKIETNEESEEVKEEKYFYFNRNITYAQANEELSYLKAAYDSLVAFWGDKVNKSRKTYLKSYEEKIEVLTKIINREIGGI